MSHKNKNHTFKEIPNTLLNLNSPPRINLTNLQNNFKRIGVNIHPSCLIENSTLQMLIELINSTLSSDQEITKEEKAFFTKFGTNTSGLRIAMDLRDAKREMNMLINISEGVRIGNNVKLYTSISIGKHTTIGNHSKIITGAKIGSNCKIGNGVLINYNSVIGDNVTIDNSTIILKSHIHDNSHIVRTSANDFTGVIKS